MLLNGRAAALLAAIALHMAPGLALGQAIVYQRAVGLNDPVPGAPSGTVFASVAVPQLEGDYVAFYGESFFDGEWVNGFYLWDGATTHRIVDSTMATEIPGATVFDLILFGQEYDVGASGLAAVLVYGTEPGWQPYIGVLGWRAGNLFPIARFGEPLPDGPPGFAFDGFDHPSVLGDRIVFSASGNAGVGPSYFGVFEWTEAGLREIPWEELAASAGSSGVATDAGAVIFGFDSTASVPGVFEWSRSLQSWTELLAFDSPIPGGQPGDRWLPEPGQFLGRLDDGIVLGARASITPGLGGLYRTSQGAPELVAGVDWVEPETGEGDAYINGRAFSASGGRVAFRARFPSWGAGWGLYTQEPDRSFRVVARPGMEIAGVPVATTEIKFASLDANRLAFVAAGPSDVAVWIADLEPELGVEAIPTLGTIGLAFMYGLLACGGAIALGRRRRPVAPGAAR